MKMISKTRDVIQLTIRGNISLNYCILGNDSIVLYGKIICISKSISSVAPHLFEHAWKFLSHSQLSLSLTIIFHCCVINLCTSCTSIKCVFQTTDGAPEQFVPWICAFCCVINKCQPHTSDKLEKWVHSVVSLCSIVVIYSEQWTFAGGINFLFSFEENCCWIIPSVSGSLRWTCSIARYAWTMVSVFEKWRLRGCRQRTWKTAKKIRRCGIVSIVGGRWFANTKTTRRVIER